VANFKIFGVWSIYATFASIAALSQSLCCKTHEKESDDIQEHVGAGFSSWKQVGKRRDWLQWSCFTTRIYAMRWVL